MNFKEKKDDSQSLEKLVEDLQTQNPGLSVTDSISRDWTIRPAMSSASYNVNISDRVDNIGDIMSFSPMLFEKLNENPFKLEDRKFPVDFNYPVTKKMVFRYPFPMDMNWRLSLKIWC